MLGIRSLVSFNHISTNQRILYKTDLDSTGGDDRTRKYLRAVPRFSAGQPSRYQIRIADLIASMVTIVFGAIHLFAWSYHFPSETEQALWRITSAITAGLPAIWVITFLMFVCGLGGENFVISLSVILSTIAIPFYVLSRIMILALAVLSLRSLPSSVYETVRWTTFIPHI